VPSESVVGHGVEGRTGDDGARGWVATDIKRRAESNVRNRASE